MAAWISAGSRDREKSCPIAAICRPSTATSVTARPRSRFHRLDRPASLAHPSSGAAVHPVGDLQRRVLSASAIAVRSSVAFAWGRMLSVSRSSAFATKRRSRSRPTAKVTVTKGRDAAQIQPNPSATAGGWPELRKG